ncbi:hypothetical protein CYL17_00290 [Thermobispora bispora]|nr:hypothetical protein [Actinomycetales bacterium]QSI46472.1 hypothetical protein CYL17_00290 [Thermobispora bispora]
MILMECGAERDQPLHLLVAGPIGRAQIKVEPVLDALPFGDSLKEQMGAATRTFDQDLVILRPALAHGPAEGIAPPSGDAVRIVAVEGDRVDLNHGPRQPRP